MGMLFSIHMVTDVISMTLMPRLITSIYDMRSSLTAAGFFLGSSVYTPSTFLAMSSTSALISAARSAAPESVEKYGLPVPHAKITMRPHSKCRSALRRINGSATDGMDSAVCTRVDTPCFSIASCKASAFMIVASMPM